MALKSFGRTIKRFMSSNVLRMVAAIFLGLFFYFLFAAIMNPGQEGPMFWMQVSFSIALLCIILNSIRKRREKVQRGMDAVNSLIPLIAGGMVTMIGLASVLSNIFGTDMGLGAWLQGGSGTLFLVLGLEIVLITLTALRSGKQTTNLFISIGTSFIIDWLVLALTNIPFWEGMSFLLIGKGAVVALLVAMGLRMDMGKGYTVEKTVSLVTNSIFVGIVFLVIILSVVFPAYYLLMYSGGEQSVSTILNLQNPIVAELIRETGLSVETTADFWLAFARALSPVDFETFTIEVGAIGTVATTAWTWLLGMSMVGAGGTEILVSDVLYGMIWLFLLIGVALVIVNKNDITFATLEKMGRSDWMDRIKQKIAVQERRKNLLGGETTKKEEEDDEEEEE